MFKVLLATVTVAIFGFVGSASAASSWKSNEFVSPSGNIHCNYGYNYITCMVASNRRQAVVGLRGGGYRVYNWPDPWVSYGYVLRYGSIYKAGPFRCYSFTSAMSCRNLRTGRGFAVSREFINVW